MSLRRSRLALARPLHRLSLLTGASVWLARRQSVARVIMYHGIGDDHPTGAFAAQMKHASAHYDVVPLAEIVRFISRSGGSPARLLALTFDDGLRNNFTDAYPVLRAMGLPATFFVSPGMTERGQWLWNQEARERLRHMTGPARSDLAREWNAPSPDSGPFVEWMKSLPDGRRHALEEAIRARTPSFAATEAMKRRYDPMSWCDLAALDPGLITIGSHTMTHAILTTLDPEAAVAEVEESRRLLERKLKRVVDYFCYPDGALDERVLASVRSTYRAAVGVERGFVVPGCDLHRIPRIPAARGLPRFAWMMHRPGR